MGVGIFAGEPWHCSATRFPNETLISNDSPEACNPTCDGCPANKTIPCDHCKSHPELVDVGLLADAARRIFAKGLIDDVKYIERMRVYTFCGTNDPSHYGATVRARDFYELFNADVLYNFTIPAGHCWPVDKDTPVPCGGGSFLPKLMSVFPLQQCHYDGPGDMLSHIYGKLRPPIEMVSRNLRLFDQKPFNAGDMDDVGLGDIGLVYVPENCSVGKMCKLHVSMHGCSNPFVLEYPEARELSFNRWAESNDIVVLWPHNVRHGTYSAERKACWDSYAETPHYDTQIGPQMRAIASMIGNLSGLRLEREKDYA